MKRIRGGSGLGDTIYVRPIAEHFVRAGHPVTVCCDYPGVFVGLDVKVEPFSRERIDVLAHYVKGKANTDTMQWQDVCKSAGVDVPLSFPWKVQNEALVARLREQAAGRPVVIVHGGRAPMGRSDGFGRELLPDRRAFETLMGALQDAFLVGIGAARPIYALPVHMDLNGTTSVSDLLDIASSCDGFVAQCSFAVPLAEVFDRPLLVLWAAGGLVSCTPYIRQITPAKVLSKPTSRCVTDDSAPHVITEAARAFPFL